MAPDEERSADLLDVALADEIELVSDLVVAASSSPRHFTPDEVDALLGIGGHGEGLGAGATAGSGAAAAVPVPDVGGATPGPSVADPAD